jgi:hypothetical protein
MARSGRLSSPKSQQVLQHLRHLFGRLHPGRRANVEAAGCSAGRRGALNHTCDGHDITSVRALVVLLPLTGDRGSASSQSHLSLRAAMHTRQPFGVGPLWAVEEYWWRVGSAR